MKKIIIGERLTKFFGQGEERNKVLDEVSVAVEANEFVTIMGPSGSGKSTLLYALSGMDHTDGGTVHFNGVDLSKASENELSDLRRTQMGFGFQQPTMLKNLNLLDNIILPSMRDHRKDVANLTIKAQTLMERVGIAGLEHRNITEVSGGQLQRAGICRALMNNPKVIFGDEPTGALNSKSAQDIMKLLLEINSEGTAVMLVTHDAHVAAWSERVLFMRDGEIVSEITLPKFEGANMNTRVDKVTEEMKVIGI